MRRATMPITLRLAFGERAGFVDDERVDFFQGLEGFGVLDEDSGVGAAAGADHDRHGSGESEGAGAGDDQDGDGIDERVREARLRTEDEPGDERDRGDGDDGGNEPGGDAIGEALDGSAAALGLADQLDDSREQSFGADALGAHDERSGGVDGGADDFAVGFFFDGDRFAGDHRFVDGAAAFEDDAIDGNFFAGTDAEAVAGFDLFERNVFFRSPSACEQARGLRAEVEQGADGGAGAAAGAEFHDLAEQDERRDGGGGFEVDVGISAHAAKRGGKNSAARGWRPRCRRRRRRCRGRSA